MRDVRQNWHACKIWLMKLIGLSPVCLHRQEAYYTIKIHRGLIKAFAHGNHEQKQRKREQEGSKSRKSWLQREGIVAFRENLEVQVKMLR